MKRFLLALIFFCLALPVHATVYINEISTYQSSGDWVELYADIEEDISGWIIKDSLNVIKTIPDDTKIGTPSDSILVFTVSNRLNRDEDVVEFFDLEDTLVDSISYGYEDAICAPEENQSIGRSQLDSQVWIRFASSTQVEENSGDESPCPTPEPSPSPSPSPTSTPTPTSSAIDSATADLTPSPSPTPTPSINPSSASPAVALAEEGTVAGLTVDSIHLTPVRSSSPSPSPNLKGQALEGPALNIVRARTALLVGFGLIAISIAGFLGYQKYKSLNQL